MQRVERLLRLYVGYMQASYTLSRVELLTTNHQKVTGSRPAEHATANPTVAEVFFGASGSAPTVRVKKNDALRIFTQNPFRKPSRCRDDRKGRWSSRKAPALG